MEPTSSCKIVCLSTHFYSGSFCQSNTYVSSLPVAKVLLSSERDKALTDDWWPSKT